MAKDIDDIYARIVEMERQIKAGTIRMATVKKDDKGHLKLLLGKKNDGTDWESPKMMKAQHHGFINENIPFEEGQSVAVLTQDGDFRNALVLPYSYSDHEPLPDDAKEKKATGRIRKPRESKEEEEKPEEAKEMENKPRKELKEYEKQKDENEKDNYWRTDYEGHYRRKKKAQYLFGEPDPEDDKAKDQSKTGQSGSGSSAPKAQLLALGDTGTGGTGSSGGQKDDQKEKGSGEKGEQHWLSVGDASITIVDGKIRFKVGKNTMIFDRDGIHAAVKGQDQQSGSSGSSGATQQQQQPKTIAEDLQDTSGKFIHTLLKDQRILQAPNNGPVHTMKLVEIVQKVGEQIFNWKKDLLEITKGKMSHDKKNIGSSHKHTQVQPGGGLTGDPNED
jgi:hypothetical protein